MSNQFLEFCPTDTGTNLLSQSDYAAATDRTIGNQPGIASSQLNNKALRQAAYVASQTAQFLANTTGADVLDDATPARLLAQFMAALQFIPPQITSYTTGASSFNATYNFMIASGNATVGATYTNNAVTYTVIATVASGTRVRMSGNGAPTVSGTLTKATGSGDATLTFYAVRAPLFLRVRMVGGGGGGAGSGSAAGTVAGDGVASTFGTTLLSAGGGTHGVRDSDGGAGGTSSLGTGPTGIALTGGFGGGSVRQSTSPTTAIAGGAGGSTVFAGGGSGGVTGGSGNGIAGVTNTGGGGGGGSAGLTTNVFTGAGGGGGGFVDAIITSPLSTYAYTVGTGGAAGGLGTAGSSGGTGAAGYIEVTEHYQ